MNLNTNLDTNDRNDMTNTPSRTFSPAESITPPALAGSGTDATVEVPCCCPQCFPWD